MLHPSGRSVPSPRLQIREMLVRADNIVLTRVFPSGEGFCLVFFGLQEVNGQGGRSRSRSKCLGGN